MIYLDYICTAKHKITTPRKSQTMNYDVKISVYMSAKDNRGVPMPLADFMRLGKERYAAEILAYRSMKKTLAEKREQQAAWQERRDELLADIERERNPLGGEDTPEVNQLKLELERADKAIENLAQEIKRAKEYADRQKTKFPAATLSGLFSPTRAKSNLVQHSGFICIDIDDHYEISKKVYYQPLDGIADVLRSLPYVLYAAHSVGGVGYFALIPLGPIDEARTHEWYFDSLREEFAQLGIVIDPACRDTTRLRFCSYDPSPIRNASAIPYMGRTSFESRNARQERLANERRRIAAEEYRQHQMRNDPDRDRRYVSICVDMIDRRHVNVAEDYDTWKKVGLSLAGAFREDGRMFFHIISRQSAKYNESDCDKAYNHFIKNANGSISLGTLFSIFKGNNVRWYDQQN